MIDVFEPGPRARGRWNRQSENREVDDPFEYPPFAGMPSMVDVPPLEARFPPRHERLNHHLSLGRTNVFERHEKDIVIKLDLPPTVGLVPVSSLGGIADC